MTATTTPTEVTRSGTDRRAIPDAALELADLQARVTVMAATAGAIGAVHTGTPEFRYYLGQIEMAREVAALIADRIEALTGRTS